MSNIIVKQTLDDGKTITVIAEDLDTGRTGVATYKYDWESERASAIERATADAINRC